MQMLEGIMPFSKLKAGRAWVVDDFYAVGVLLVLG